LHWKGENRIIQPRGDKLREMNRMSQHWLIVGLLLAMAMTAWSQGGSICRVYDMADGFPETACGLISAGPRGRVLVEHPRSGTLSWLDGYEVKTLPAPHMKGRRAYESPGGQIWSVWPGGLEEYDGKTWNQFRLPEIEAFFSGGHGDSKADLRLWPTRQGRVLFLLPSGLMEFNSENPKASQSRIIRKSSQTALGHFIGMTPAFDGGLWVTGENGVAKLSAPARNITVSNAWKDFVPSGLSRLRNFDEPIADEEGGVTALAKTSPEGAKVVVHFDGRRWLTLPVGAENVLQAWRASANSYCIASKESVMEFDEDSAGMQLSQEVAVRQFSDLATDAQGVFWLATAEGLFRYAPSTWLKPAPLRELNAPVESMAEDSAGRFWLLETNCLHEMQEDRWRTHALPEWVAKNLHGKPGLFPVGNGNIVIGGGDELVQYRSKTETFEVVPGSAGKRLKALGLFRKALCVQELPSDGKGPAQLAIYDGESITNFPLPQPEMDLGEASHFFASPGGDLWLSGERGLARYHRKEWETFAPAEGNVPEAALCLAEISDGRIWCGTAGKIWEFDGKAWSLIRAGFDQVNDLIKSRDGSVWVATNKGLHRLHQGAWAANGAEEGLPAQEIRQIYEDSRGRIWLGTKHGATLYHPEADPDPPHTYIQPPKDAKNSALEGMPFTVSFRGRDKWKYTPAERLLYSYRLDEQDWSPFQEEQVVTFSEVPAGRHHFQVRAMDRNWNIDPKPALLEFAITLPWYRETRLALVIGGATIVVLFFGGLAFNRHRQLLRSYAEVEEKVTLRTKELEIANQELLHSQKMNALGTLAAGIAHDFNNILSIIKGSAQIIEENLENREKIQTRVGRIKTVVEQGAGIVRAMLGFSRESDQQAQSCDVNEVVEETIRLLGDRFMHEVEVKVETTPSLPEVSASKDLIQQILLNFIFNAAEAIQGRKQIILRTSQADKLPALMALTPLTAPVYVCISVEDFGSGIAPEVMPRIFEPFFTTKAMSARRGTGLGLSMVYELAKQIRSGLAVQSSPGKGSIFTLIIPAGNPAEKQVK
jgi:signal transduction histidine kinase